MIRALWRAAVPVLWAPAAVIVLHWVLAEIFGHEPHVDPAMHFLGGIAAALFFGGVWVRCPEYVGRATPMGADVAAFGLACAMAVLWEIGEFASDQFLGTDVQKSLENTMRDMILGFAGAMLYAATRILHRARH